MNCDITIRVQSENFDLQSELLRLARSGPQTGALASFMGVVRDGAGPVRLHALTLEHYPGMTESVLRQIATDAAQRFDVLALSIIHRVGRMAIGEPIVGIGVLASHRASAFRACEFLIDHLKTQAPFWKKEHRDDGDFWVEARLDDDFACQRWRFST